MLGKLGIQLIYTYNNYSLFILKMSEVIDTYNNQSLFTLTITAVYSYLQ